jgi:hypothetical protein
MCPGEWSPLPMMRTSPTASLTRVCEVK